MNEHEQNIASAVEGIKLLVIRAQDDYTNGDRAACYYKLGLIRSVLGSVINSLGAIEDAELLKSHFAEELLPKQGFEFGGGNYL